MVNGKSKKPTDMKIYLLTEDMDDGFQGSHDVTLSVHRTREGAEKARRSLAEPKYQEYVESGGLECCKKRPADWIGAWYESEPSTIEDFEDRYNIEEVELLD